MSLLITFDLDNTLWDVDPVIVRADQAMVHWFEDRFPGFGQRFPASVLQELKASLLKTNGSLKIDISGIRIELYKQALVQFGLPSSEAEQAARMAFQYFHEWRQKVDHYPEAHTVLEHLAEQYSLAVITNGNADIFHPAVGLGHVFQFAVRADQEGVAKPDVRLFQMASERASVAMSDMIHVGDNPVDDVLGANLAGCRSIWFNRHGAQRWLDSWQGRPDAEIHNLKELPAVIANWAK